MTSHRPEKVGVLIRGILARLLREEARDPRIGFVTITEVKVSADLKHATVYFTFLGKPEERSECEDALRRATPFFRRALAREAGLRQVPEVRFAEDQSIEKGFRVDELLREIEAGAEPRIPDRDGTEDPGSDG